MKPKIRRIETMQAILIAFLAALIMRQFVIAAYKIPTGSMENTLLVGDFLLVNKFVYGAKMPDWVGIPFTRWKKWSIPTGVELPRFLRFRLPALAHPKPHDILVFKYPRDPHLEYIKRCIAMGGQIVEIRDKQVFVNGIRFPDPPGVKYIDAQILPRDAQWYSIFRSGLGSRDNFGPLQVDDHYYFVMGDNRDDSSDSRQWGFVPEANIVGKPLIVYLSLGTSPDNEGSFFNRLRWNRLGMVIR